MNKKLMIAGLILAIFMSGCGKKDAGNETKENIESVKVTLEDSEKTEQEELFDLSKLSDYEFYFSSGAGGWRTFLDIEEDGSFRGQYSDSEMGSVGEDYPNGTYYLSDFTGKMSVSEKINDYTYALKIENIDYENTVDTEEIIDEMLYIYCEAHGIGDAEEVLLYLPGAPMKKLPDAYKNWIMIHMEDPETEKLPFYGLYNEAEETGFCSYMVGNPIEIMMESTKSQSLEIKTSLETEELNQQEMNEKSVQLYEIWDTALNQLWTELKNQLSEEEYQELLEEQREWINEKEESVKEAGEEVEGGSLHSLTVHMTAAAITEERVYELYDLWAVRK